MKQILAFAFLISGITATAQNKGSKSILLSKGQTINVVNINTSDADMGMGMQMKNNITLNSTLVVSGENEVDYLITNTLTRAKGSMEVMGKLNEFDSDNKADRDSEIGKSFAETVGKPVEVSVNKFSGMPNAKEKTGTLEKSEPNPMEDIIKAFGNDAEDAAVIGAFLLIPGGKKTGDTWVETDSTKERKIIKSYTLDAVNNKEATIQFTSSASANNTLEVQGNQVDVSITTKSNGTIMTDIKTGLVSKRVVDSDISGTIEMMGQSMPVTAKSHLESVYTLVNK